MPPYVVLEPRRSRTWRGLWLVLLLAVCLLLPVSGTDARLALVVLAGTLVAVCVALRAGGWAGGAPAPAVRYGGQGWQLRPAGTGEWQPVRLRADCLVSTRLVILRFDGSGRRPVSVPVFADAVDRESHRRLRVILRWGPAPGGVSAAAG